MGSPEPWEGRGEAGSFPCSRPFSLLMDLQAEFPWWVYFSLKSREDRRAALLPQLGVAGMEAEWFPTVDGQALGGETRGFLTPGRRALALTNRRALREAGRRRAGAVGILQDDAVFHGGFAARAAALTLPEDWGIFYFGCQHIEPPERHSPGLVRVRRAVDAHAFAVRAPHYLRVRKALRGGGKGARDEAYPDILLSWLHREIPTYAAFPNLIWQAEGWSDLLGREHCNYDADGGQRLWREAVGGLA